MSMRLLWTTLATGLALLTGGPYAQAATTQVIESNPAVQACHAALPAYEGTLRKRPKAIQNEGTTSAFVSCGLQGHGSLGIGPNTISTQVHLHNISATSVTVSCTAIDSTLGTFATGSNTLPPNGNGSVYFEATDLHPNAYWYTATFSCRLPPGAAIKEIWHTFKQEVGA